MMQLGNYYWYWKFSVLISSSIFWVLMATQIVCNESSDKKSTLPPHFSIPPLGCSSTVYYPKRIPHFLLVHLWCSRVRDNYRIICNILIAIHFLLDTYCEHYPFPIFIVTRKTSPFGIMYCTLINHLLVRCSNIVCFIDFQKSMALLSGVTTGGRENYRSFYTNNIKAIMHVTRNKPIRWI
jgi:hypothetical protein